MDTIAICAAFHDAAPRILEWIAFHRLVGVDRFVLYDMGSTDGTADLIARSRFAHQATVIPWARSAGRPAPYADFVANHAERFTWAVIIEPDEFLHPLDANTIRTLLPRYDGFAAVLLRRLTFVTSGPQSRPGQFIIGNYTTRVQDDKRQSNAAPTLLRTAAFHRVNATPPGYALTGAMCNARGEIVPAGQREAQACDDVMVVNRYPGPATEESTFRLTPSNPIPATPLDGSSADPQVSAYGASAAVPDRRIMRFIPGVRAMLHDASRTAPSRPAQPPSASDQPPSAPVTHPAEPAQPPSAPAQPLAGSAQPLATPAQPATTPAQPLSASAQPLATPAQPATTPAQLPLVPAPAATPAIASLLLGIGIITYNRQAILSETLDRVQQHTRHPRTIVAVADDGSIDGTLDMLRARQVLTVTGRNMSIAWNKNRALFLLSELLRCDVVVLLEDDAYPTRDNWEIDWMDAAIRWGHANVAGQTAPEHFAGGAGTVQDPIYSQRITAHCASFSREALQFGGYFDTRFREYGHEHVEHTLRLLRMGYGGTDEPVNGFPGPLFKLLWGGIDYHAVPSPIPAKEAQAERNRELAQTLFRDFSYRAPWQNEAEARQLRDEMRHSFPRAVL